MRRHRRAKIVATVGPASDAPEMLKALLLAGVDTFRLNFSHGTQGDHARVHAAIRKLEEDVNRPIGILMDLQGPKIRVGTLRGGKIVVEAGETIRFVLSGSDGDRSAIPLPHPEIFAAVAPGHDLLIDDGSADRTVEVAEGLAKKYPRLQISRHETPRGFGAALRTGLASAKHPLFFYSACKPGYRPNDLKRLLEIVRAHV